MAKLSPAEEGSDAHVECVQGRFHMHIFQRNNSRYVNCENNYLLTIQTFSPALRKRDSQEKRAKPNPSGPDRPGAEIHKHINK